MLTTYDVLQKISVLMSILSSVVNLSPPGVHNLNAGQENMMNKQKYMVLALAISIWAKSPFVKITAPVILAKKDGLDRLAALRH